MGAPDTVLEDELWRRWRSSQDAAARASLIEMHLPYARTVAATCYSRRFNDDVEFDDYLQLATVGMLESLERFDPEFGARFRTFASRRMHGAIVDGIEQFTEKQQQISARARVEAQRRESIRESAESPGEGRAPTPAERTTEQLLQYVAEAGMAFALSWLLDGSGMIEAEEPRENIPFYRSMELREMRRRILALVRGLPPQERAVIEGHYFGESSFQDIANRMNVGKSRVSQIHKSALVRLGDSLRHPSSCDVFA